MTCKEILRIASDEVCMLMLKEIGEMQANMGSKTVYEQKTAKAEIKRIAKELLEYMNE